MPIHFDHTLVAARDKHHSARFFAEIFGLPEPELVGQINTNHGGRGVCFDDVWRSPACPRADNLSQPTTTSWDRTRPTISCSPGGTALFQ